jgi:hypothetical protein
VVIEEYVVKICVKIFFMKGKALSKIKRVKHFLLVKEELEN